MTNIFLAACATLAVIGLIIVQLRSMKKHHPNAELLIGFLKTIELGPVKK